MHTNDTSVIPIPKSGRCLLTLHLLYLLLYLVLSLPLTLLLFHGLIQVELGLMEKNSSARSGKDASLDYFLAVFKAGGLATVICLFHVASDA